MVDPFVRLALKGWRGRMRYILAIHPWRGRMRYIHAIHAIHHTGGMEGCDICKPKKQNIFLLFLRSLTGLYFRYILCFERLTFSEVGGWMTPNIRDPMNTCLSFQQTCFGRISYARDQKKYCRFSLNPPTHLWKRLSIRL